MFKEMVAVVGICLIIVGLIFFGSVWIMNEVSFPASQTKIEQLRIDSAKVDPLQAEDVIGQVTEWNQIIKSNQAYNRNWFTGLVTPDGWDSIQLIPVPSH
jgi:hypothetical protein